MDTPTPPKPLIFHIEGEHPRGGMGLTEVGFDKLQSLIVVRDSDDCLWVNGRRVVLYTSPRYSTHCLRGFEVCDEIAAAGITLCPSGLIGYFCRNRAFFPDAWKWRRPESFKIAFPSKKFRPVQEKDDSSCFIRFISWNGQGDPEEGEIALGSIWGPGIRVAVLGEEMVLPRAV